MANIITFVYPFGSQPSIDAMSKVQRLIVDAELDNPISIPHNMNTPAGMEPKVTVTALSGAACPVQFTDPNTVTLAPTDHNPIRVRVYIERVVPAE